MEIYRCNSPDCRQKLNAGIRTVSKDGSEQFTNPGIDQPKRGYSIRDQSQETNREQYDGRAIQLTIPAEEDDQDGCDRQKG